MQRVDENPADTYLTGTGTESSAADASNKEKIFRNKQLNKFIEEVKLEDSTLSQKLIEKTSEDVLDNNFEINIKGGHQDLRALNDYFNLQQDSVSKRTKSQCEIPAHIFDEIHGEMGQKEKTRLAQQGIIVREPEMKEGVNSLDQSTNQSDGMGLLTHSQLSQDDPLEVKR